MASIPVALHLDHGDTFDLAKACIDSGFSSVMIDGSHHPFEENVRLTRQVVDYAHPGTSRWKAELGVLAGIEDEVSAAASHYTRPEEVEDFVDQTGVDSLAISIGTSHGAFKFKVKPGEEPPPLRFDILEEIERRLPGFPIVLHGASTVMPEYVDLINQYGGRMEAAVGVSEEQMRTGRQLGGLQDQHRQRRPPGHDRDDPENLCRKARRVRPSQISGSGPGRTDQDGQVQERAGAHERRQSLRPSRRWGST